jgi:hypothetical protein
MRMIGHTAYLVFARKVEKLQERVHQPASQEEEEEEEKEEIGNKEEVSE